MEYTANEVICKCKHVTLADIDRALHQHTSFTDVEKEFDEVQKLTSCSTGCGGCQLTCSEKGSRISGFPFFVALFPHPRQQQSVCDEKLPTCKKRLANFTAPCIIGTKKIMASFFNSAEFSFCRFA